jgi:hypothetical protein
MHQQTVRGQEEASTHQKQQKQISDSPAVYHQSSSLPRQKVRYQDLYAHQQQQWSHERVLVSGRLCENLKLGMVAVRYG